MFNHENYFQFIQIKPTQGDYSFLSYTDKEGNTLKGIASIDHNGNKRPFVVTWSARNRIYRGVKTKKIMVEVNGKVKEMLLYDYIKGYDRIENSPNQRGVALIKELDEVKDAKLAIDRKKLVAKAATTALGLDGQDLADMAAMIGVFKNDPDVQKFRVTEFADQNPEAFFEMFDAPDFKVKALVRRAISAGTAKKKGKSIECNGELHADEQDLVSALLKDEKKLMALTKQTAKLS